MNLDLQGREHGSSGVIFSTGYDDGFNPLQLCFLPPPADDLDFASNCDVGLHHRLVDPTLFIVSTSSSSIS